MRPAVSMELLQRTFGLDGRTVWVVGASSGLGARCATACAGAGAHVVLSARRAERLAEQAASLRAAGARCDVVELDVTDDAAVAAAAEAIEHQHGPIYGLLNAAGLSRLGRAERHRRDRWDEVFAVNADAAFVLSREVGARMIARGDGGRIVHISSVLGRGANPIHRNVGYCASKGAVDNLVRQLAVEWAAHGITVNALAPGFFPTEMTVDPSAGDIDPAMTETIRTFTPLGRPGALHEIDSAALFLLAPGSSYVTGVLLPVDGGWTSW